MKRPLFLCLILLVGSTAAKADHLVKGDREVMFTFSYSDLNPDSGSDIQDTNLEGSFGYLLTDGHEVGGLLGYTNLSVGDSDVDSTSIGAFYHYNFRAGEILNPYVGAHILAIGGDLGDVYDFRLGVEGGIKVYPWSHGGFNFGVTLDRLDGASGSGDADSISAFAGLQFKF